VVEDRGRHRIDPLGDFSKALGKPLTPVFGQGFLNLGLSFSAVSLL
jgi:hypothetical protein